MDLEIMEFYKTINKFVLKSTLPDEVKRMILEKVLSEQEMRTFETVRKQIEERNKMEVGENAESV